MLKRYFAIIFVLLTAVVGCSSPKSASKENFKKAINAYYVKKQVYIFDTSVTNNFKFPVKIKTDMFTNNLIDSYQALVSANLLSVKDTSVKEDVLLFGKGGKRTVPVKEYELTDNGKKYYKEAATTNMITGNLNGFIVGQPEVIEVTSYTEPADSAGVKISNVSYKVKVSNIPEWAKKSEVYTSYPNIKKYLDPSIDAQITLILKNDGWVVAE